MPRRKKKSGVGFWVRVSLALAISAFQAGLSIYFSVQADSNLALAKKAVEEAQECGEYLSACAGIVARQSEGKDDGHLR